MRPNRNKPYCKDCGQHKILFETEQQANNFIKFNSDEIKAESGVKPIRSYFCIACAGWHITSKATSAPISKTEIVLALYKQEQERIIIEKQKAKERAKRTALEIARERQIQEIEKLDKLRIMKIEILDNVDKLIVILKEKHKESDDIEFLNKAFEELEKAKQITVAFKGDIKRQNRLDKKLKQLQKKLIQSNNQK